MKKLRNILAGAMLGASLFFTPVQSHAQKKEDLTHMYSKPTWEEILNETYSVEMIDEYKKKTQQKLQLTAIVCDEEKFIQFDYQIENFDKTNWTREEERIPLNKRHTNINHTYTRVFILHPKEVRISGLEQAAYIIPPHRWEVLEPLEKSPKAELILKGGEKVVDWAIKKSKIPFAKELFDKFVEYSREKERENYNEMFKKINENYVVTQIPSFPIDTFRAPIETARAYKVFFDTANAKDEEIPLTIWTKIALGDPSLAPHGSFPNKYGELEGIAINFSLRGYSLKDYFLHKKELEGITLASREFLETSDFQGPWKQDYFINPQVLTKNQIDENYKIPGLEATGKIIYVIPSLIQERTRESYAKIEMGIFKFDSKESAENNVQRSRLNEDLDPYDLGNRIILSTKDGKAISIIKTNNIETNRQAFIYLDMLKNYHERIEGKVLGFDNMIEWKNEELKLNLQKKEFKFLLEEIKNKINNPPKGYEDMPINYFLYVSTFYGG